MPTRIPTIPSTDSATCVAAVTSWFSVGVIRRSYPGGGNGNRAGAFETCRARGCSCNRADRRVAVSFTSALDKTLEFVRPAGGRRVVAKPHVPLLALMAPSNTDTGRVVGGSVLRR